MRRFRSKTFLALLLTLGIGAALLGWWNSRRVGRVLDSYRGVSVYDNGFLFFRSYGRNYGSNGYYFGQKWQCVEFVKRFYFEAKNHKMPDGMGHAKSFFEDGLADGGLNSRRGLFQFRNGSPTKPSPDDLMVFTNTTYGHVAIVTTVGDDSIEVIQQNILSGSRQRFSLAATNGHYYVSGSRQPAGWLRLGSKGQTTK